MIKIKSKSENAVEFMLYSCCGIELDDEASDILQKIVARAYRDAASHVLSVEKDWWEQNDSEPKNAKDAASGEIIKAIENLSKEVDFDVEVLL